MFRYVSTLGPQFATPIYFDTKEAAQHHHKEVQRLLGDLPGINTMRIEHLDDENGWYAFDEDTQ